MVIDVPTSAMPPRLRSLDTGVPGVDIVVISLSNPIPSKAKVDRLHSVFEF